MKTIITGVDGNLGSFAASSIMNKMPKSDLIFTSPLKNVLDTYRQQDVESRVADYNDVDQLKIAFAGAHTLLLVSLPFVGEKRRRLHKNAIDGAKAAGVKKIIYTSTVGAGDPTNGALVKVDHDFTEEYIYNCGLEWIILRNSQYVEAMISSFQVSASANGILSNNQGEGRMAYVTRNDCAEAAACVSAGAGNNGTVYNICGPELMSLTEFVEIGSEVSKQKVVYQFITDEQQYAVFDSLGIPRTTEGDFSKAAFPFCSDDMVSYGRAIREGKMNSFTNHFEFLTGKKPMSVRCVFEHMEEHLIGDRNAKD